MERPLTSYNGEEITYDAIGNPTSYLGSTLTWKGHQLSNITKGSTKASYTYDANGLRTTKTVNGTKTYYQYSGDKLIYQETGNKRLYFWYDAFGCLCEVLYDDNGTASAYMVVCNSRGDVERLYDVTGNLAARYVYDSWGNVISVVDQYSKPITNQNAIGNVNPIRYRGYYLDSETGYYYLQSRYYNPQLGRFLNADLYCDTETGALGTNMFAYCENNPVMRFDSGGQFWDYVFDAAFVCWSIYDVVNDPSDWKNWAALGVDVVFAVLPFVPSGAGQIVKVGNKVDNALEVASSIRKMDKVMDISKVTLIGRRMERVTRTAIAIGKADNLYKTWSGYKGVASISKFLANSISVAHNGAWLFKMLRTGYTVIDIGVTSELVKLGLWYGIETFVSILWQTRNIWKFFINIYLSEYYY